MPENVIAVPDPAVTPTAVPAQPAQSSVDPAGAAPNMPVGGPPPGSPPITPTPIVVPDKYDLKAPADSKFDATSIERTAATARSLGLSQEQAAKLLEHDVSVLKTHDESQLKGHWDKVKEWEAEARADKEFGGENFDANVAMAQRLIEKKASPKFKELLKTSGYGNHPELIRMVWAIAKDLEPSKTAVPASAPRPQGKSVEEIRYPNMFNTKGATASAAA